MLVAYCVEIFLLLGFAAYASMLNRKKEQALQREGLCYEDVYMQGSEEDQTDKEDKFFRYHF